MRFIGREEQLMRLEGLWQKGTASLVTVRGRRRIGKSTLIGEFASRTADAYFVLEGQAPGVGVTKRVQIRSFLEQLSVQTGGARLRASNWLEALEQLWKELPGEGRVVVLLDEISWMSEGDQAFAGTLKIAWDRWFRTRANLVFVLCGSVSSWIAENILQGTGFVGRDSLDLVVEELSLRESVLFWGDALDRTPWSEVFDYLSVTGGVPKYLEELNPAKTTEENIRSLCFTKEGLLFREFEQIFHSIFGRRSENRRAVLEALSGGSRSISEIADALGCARNGHMGETLKELELAGFVAKEWNVSPRTGRVERVARYRVKDNYTRFYLHYVAPFVRQIEAGLFQGGGLSSLVNWETIRGLQFENLIVSNYRALLPILGVEGASLRSAAPYRRGASKSGGRGVQIDLLIQTQTTLYVVEVKRRAQIEESVVDEIRSKVEALQLSATRAVRTVLVYLGELAPRIRTEHWIDFLIPVERLAK